MQYQFTDDCLTGIPHIDDEHRMLFELVNNVELDLQDGFDVKDILKALLPRLIEYADFHFKDEEAYMEKINDPELPIQKKEHDEFRKTVSEFSFENLSEEEAREELSKVMSSIAHWLYHHILGSDIMIGKMVTNSNPENDDEDPFAFTDKYKTGIDFVDKEHSRLFEIIRETNDLINTDDKFDKYDQIVDILQELLDYTEKHFADEEEYMSRIHYEGLEAQKLSHEAFVTKLKSINMEELDENQGEYLNNLIQFLLSWLSNHILKMDKLIPNK